MRVWQNGCEQCGLFCSQSSCRFVKIMFCGGFNSEDAVAELNDVQVGFQNAVFSPARLQKNSKISFQAFANPVLVRPQEEILCGLLRYGTRAVDPLSVLVVVDRPLNCRP